MTYEASHGTCVLRLLLIGTLLCVPVVFAGLSKTGEEFRAQFRHKPFRPDSNVRSLLEDDESVSDGVAGVVPASSEQPGLAPRPSGDAVDPGAPRGNTGFRLVVPERYYNGTGGVIKGSQQSVFVSVCKLLWHTLVGILRIVGQLCVDLWRLFRSLGLYGLFVVIPLLCGGVGLLAFYWQLRSSVAIAKLACSTTASQSVDIPIDGSKKQRCISFIGDDAKLASRFLQPACRVTRDGVDGAVVWYATPLVRLRGSWKKAWTDLPIFRQLELQSAPPGTSQTQFQRVPSDLLQSSSGRECVGRSDVVMSVPGFVRTEPLTVSFSGMPNAISGPSAVSTGTGEVDASKRRLMLGAAKAAKVANCVDRTVECQGAPVVSEGGVDQIVSADCGTLLLGLLAEGNWENINFRLANGKLSPVCPATLADVECAALVRRLTDATVRDCVVRSITKTKLLLQRSRGNGQRRHRKWDEYEPEMQDILRKYGRAAVREAYEQREQEAQELHELEMREQEEAMRYEPEGFERAEEAAEFDSDALEQRKSKLGGMKIPVPRDWADTPVDMQAKKAWLNGLVVTRAAGQVGRVLYDGHLVGHCWGYRNYAIAPAHLFTDVTEMGTIPGWTISGPKGAVQLELLGFFGPSEQGLPHAFAALKKAPGMSDISITEHRPIPGEAVGMPFYDETSGKWECRYGPMTGFVAARAYWGRMDRDDKALMVTADLGSECGQSGTLWWIVQDGQYAPFASHIGKQRDKANDISVGWVLDAATLERWMKQIDTKNIFVPVSVKSSDPMPQIAQQSAEPPAKVALAPSKPTWENVAGVLKSVFSWPESDPRWKLTSDAFGKGAHFGVLRSDGGLELSDKARKWLTSGDVATMQTHSFFLKPKPAGRS